MSLELQKFLNKGAFLRHPDGHWVLGFGEPSFSEQPSRDGYSFYVNDFFLKKTTPWVTFEKTIELDTSTLQKSLEFDPQPKMRSPEQILRLATMGSAGGFKLADWSWAQASRSQFSQNFNSIMGSIRDQSLQKAVPITFESTNEVPDDQLKKGLLHRLLIADEHQTPYGYWDEQQGVLGVTPETLFKREGNKIETMALAGTRVTDNNDGPKLLDNPKDLKEHNFVVESIKQQLSALGLVQQENTREWPVGLLTHLLTPLNLTLQSPISDNQLISILHPTPALGTYPQEKAFDWYQKDPVSRRRSFFGSPFGVSHPEGSYYCVAIRNIIWDGVTTFLFSGCGVVSESLEENEWQELFAKRTSVKHQLGL